MRFYDEIKSMYLETDASGEGLGVSLLQTRSGTSCPRDTALDNTILRPIAFASKSPSSTKKRYSDIEREALGILHSLKKFHHYCFTREVSNQESCSNTITKTTVNSPQNTQIQSLNNIQTWHQ